MRRSIAVKVTAFLLSVLSLIVAALSVFAFVGMMAGSFYTKPLEAVRESVLSDLAYRETFNAANKFHFSSEESMEKYVSRRNYYFEIRDLDGNIRYSNLNGNSFDFS